MISTVLGLAYLDDRGYWRVIGRCVLAVGILALLLVLVSRFPYVSSIPPWLAMSGGLCALWLWPRRGFVRVRSLVTLTACLAVVFDILPSDTHYQALPEGVAFALGVHVASAVMGQFLASIGFVVALIFLWQHGLLKRKDPSLLKRRFFPALSMWEMLLPSVLWTAVVFLTLALLSGFVYSHESVQEALRSQVGKTLWAFSVWGWYLGTLLYKEVVYLSTYKLAKMSVLGFSLLTLTFYGLYFYGI